MASLKKTEFKPIAESLPRPGIDRGQARIQPPRRCGDTSVDPSRACLPKYHCSKILQSAWLVAPHAHQHQEKRQYRSVAVH
ncbi:hypothetical protein FOBRF1_014805 [Fusarium oxysporum]